MKFTTIVSLFALAAAGQEHLPRRAVPLDLEAQPIPLQPRGVTEDISIIVTALPASIVDEASTNVGAFSSDLLAAFTGTTHPAWWSGLPRSVVSDADSGFHSPAPATTNGAMPQQTAVIGAGVAGAIGVLGVLAL